MSGFGLASYGGALYTFDQVADLLREIDPATGGTVASYDLGLDLVGEGSLAFDGGGQGYLTRSSSNDGYLYKFTVGGTGSLVGSISGGTNAVNSLDGLDFNPSNGLFYGVTQTQAGLYTLDVSTGALSSIGLLGVDGGSLAGLAFDATGNLFAVFSSGLFYSVNTTTGVATLVGDTGFTDISGLEYVAPIPEPATLLLLGTGLGAVAARRRMKKRA